MCPSSDDASAGRAYATHTGAVRNTHSANACWHGVWYHLLMVHTSGAGLAARRYNLLILYRLAGADGWWRQRRHPRSLRLFGTSVTGQGAGVAAAVSPHEGSTRARSPWRRSSRNWYDRESGSTERYARRLSGRRPHGPGTGAGTCGRLRRRPVPHLVYRPARCGHRARRAGFHVQWLWLQCHPRS
jgi:hypothetical protein